MKRRSTKKSRGLGATAAEHAALLPENEDLAKSWLHEAMDQARHGDCSTAIKRLALGARKGGVADTHRRGPDKLDALTTRAAVMVTRFCAIGRR